MPGSYRAVFSGNTINPTLLSYIAYTIGADIDLVWPLEALPGANVAADKIDITTTVGSLSVTLPPADQVSVGQDLLFRNVGANTYFVFDTDGIQIAQVNSGEAWYIVLTDNSDSSGTWYAIEYGVGTSSATAASLAGAGLIANLSRLDQNLLTATHTIDYTVIATDLALALENAGGTVTWTLTSAVTLGNGFFFYLRNSGSGDVVLTPGGGQTIDGGASKTYSPTESSIVFCDGANFYTIGFGRALVNTVTLASIPIGGGAGTTVLTNVQVAAQVQDWSGTLTGNRILEYGGDVGYWFVQNNTTGAFTVTARVNGIDAGAVVPQGFFSILRSNGTNMEIAFTDLGGTVTSVAAGTGLTATPGPIVTAGTIRITDTAVTPAAYGSASSIPHFTVNQQGQLTAAGADALSIANSAVVTSAQLASVISDETGTGVLVFGTAPTISSPNLTGTPVSPTNGAPTDSSTQIATDAFVQAAIAAFAANNVFVTGDIKHTLNGTLATGWLFLNGQSIGSATSGATGRANADTAALYSFFWNNYSNALCPVATGRGGSGAADFAANKALTMLDARGAALAGADNMGTAGDAGKLGTGVTGGFAGAATLGTSAGEKSHVDTIAEMPAHTHDGTLNGGDVALAGGASAIASGSITGSTGGGGAHNNVQWTLVCNVWVKL